MTWTILLTACLTFSIVFPAPAFAQSGKQEADKTLLLKIGDPRFKDKTVDVGRGVIVSAALGGVVSSERMAEEMKAVPYIYVGETHTSQPMHDIQLQVLRVLYAQSRDIAVGLEMLPVGVQETLNAWTLGLLGRDDFLRQVRWYVHWSYNFGFYEKIFNFAKEHRLPVYGLNIPREVISKIRMRGWEALTEEERILIPVPPDLANKDHRVLIRAIFESTELPPQMKGAGLDMVFEGLYRSQSAWDEVMASNAVRSSEREGRRMVILAGSGHLLYNLGINRRAHEKSGRPFKTVLAVEVPPGQTAVRVSRTYADYIFGIPEEEEPVFPTVGLSFKTVENLGNLVVENKPTDGAAVNSGFEKGDIVLSVDGRTFSDANEVRIYLAGFRYGNEAKFRILRQGQVKDVILKFESRSLNQTGRDEKEETALAALSR